MSGARPGRSALDEFLSGNRAALVVRSGPASGMEFVLDQRAIRLGRGPGVDLSFDDPSLEIRHARLEFRASSYWLCNVARDATTNLNGAAISEQELKHDDRIQLGKLSFEYTLEPRAPLSASASSLRPFP